MHQTKTLQQIPNLQLRETDNPQIINEKKEKKKTKKKRFFNAVINDGAIKN